MKKIYHKDGEPKDKSFEVGKQPEGWVLGRSPAKAKACAHRDDNNSPAAKIWITNGTETKYIPKDDPIPEGWHKGRTIKWTEEALEAKRAAGRKNKGKAKPPVSEETKKKHSESLYKYYETHDGPNKGKKLSPERIEQLRQINLGNTYNKGKHYEYKPRPRKTALNGIVCEKFYNIERGYPLHTAGKRSRAKFDKPFSELTEEEIKALGMEEPYVYRKSYKEQEVADFIKSIYSGTIIRNDRTVLKPKELDIYIPEKNVAIEYTGLVWHSAMKEAIGYGALDPNAIREKSDECRAKGIRLIHVREDQWRDKQDIVKSIIASSLGVYEHKYFARKLKFLPIDSKTANEFLDHNHIKGGTRCKAAFGLYNGLQLLQVVTFRPKFVNSKSNKKGLELARMATLKNNQVVGGFSRLMKDSLRALGETSCESYVDLALFNASGYNSSGWKVVKPNVGIGYAYTDSYSVLGRQCFMKKSCYEMWKSDYPNVDYKDLTEGIMTSDHGWFPIYDAGNALVQYDVA